MATLGMTLKQAAFRLGTPVDTIKGCGANAGDRRKKALGSLTRITR